MTIYVSSNGGTERRKLKAVCFYGREISFSLWQGGAFQARVRF
jgi:hypothetical protein